MNSDFFQENESDKKNRRIGVYATLIFHLVLIIILLSTGIGTLIQKETSFIMDFTKVEEAEKRMLEEQKKERLKADAAKELEKILGAAPKNVRNTVADKSNTKDSKFNMSEVYADNDRLQDRLKKSKKQAELDRAAEEDAIAAEEARDRKKPQDAKYTGAEVVSYSLDGRKGIHLEVPAYQCQNGGQLTVVIVVNQAGNVIDAYVDRNLYPDVDSCLESAAVRAAKNSHFMPSYKAPKKQVGEIVYLFVAQ